MEVKLTEKEVELFELLLASLKHKGASTTIRVAGGWVRDKLLQQQSVDIDVALDDQSGLDFATGVNEYLKHRGLETRTIAVIQANPDQSKHLETANLRVLGYEIDCVNLRAETYTDTRIPEIRKGTALEDALRRDFTINALFFNLNTKSVEDLTERGIPDLYEGVIRTPISAHITFCDDPLRVLRAVRFASRLQFRLDPELAAAASSAEVRAAIHDKVSRERIYKECEGCMTKENSRPYLAFTLIDRLNLLDVVLPLERVLASHTLTLVSATDVGADVGRFVSCWLSHAMRVMHGVNLLVSLRQQSSNGTDTWQAVRAVESEGSDRLTVTEAAQAAPKFGTSTKALYWAALTAYLGRLQVLEKGKPVPLIPVLLREGLKMENATMKSVQTMAEGVAQMMLLAPVWARMSIDDAGNVLRSCKELWRDCVLLACANELAAFVEDRHTHRAAQSEGPRSGEKRHLPEESESDGVIATGAVDVNAQVFFDKQFSRAEVEILRKYAALEDSIVGMGLDGVWLVKPLLNGGDLMKELQLPKGPMVGKLMEEQTKWQIRHPGSTDRAACLDYLRSIAPSLSSSV